MCASQDALPDFSRKRAPEAKALVQLSRSFDRGGLVSFVTFILPLILDGIFHSKFPKLFCPNTLVMLQKPELSFRSIRRRKRLDRVAQLALIGGTSVLCFRLLAVLTRALHEASQTPASQTPVPALVSWAH